MKRVYTEPEAEVIVFDVQMLTLKQNESSEMDEDFVINGFDWDFMDVPGL